MSILQKIKGFFKKKTVFKPKKRINALFSVVQLIIYGVGMDMAFNKVAEIDFKLATGQISALEAHGFFYVYLLIVGGFFMAMGFFRLLEIYWYIKDVKQSLYTVTNEWALKSFKVVKKEIWLKVQE